MSNSGLQVNAFLDILLFPTSFCCNTGAGETMRMRADFTTDGPVRPGVIEYSIDGSRGGATVDGVGGPCLGCTAPFTLGVPFEVVLMANAFASCEAGVGCFFLASRGSADLVFQIIDPQTAAPVELHDITVPEPRGLVGCGLLGLIGAAWSRRKRLQLSRASLSRGESRSA